jgi:transketolase
MGLSYAAGSAIAARLQGSSRRVFVLLSDGECNEGAVWEAASFAAHQRLGNLCAIVDANGQQALGQTRDVLDMEPLREKWNAFGWQTTELSGHDTFAMAQAFESVDLSRAKPCAIIARTTFGHGVAFMEGQISWHYLPMSDAQYADAMKQIGTDKIVTTNGHRYDTSGAGTP